MNKNPPKDQFADVSVKARFVLIPFDQIKIDTVPAGLWSLRRLGTAKMREVFSRFRHGHARRAWLEISQAEGPARVRRVLCA